MHSCRVGLVGLAVLGACGSAAPARAPSSGPVVVDPGAGVDAPAASPEPEVEYSVSVQKNIERGQRALADGYLIAADKYFRFAVMRFPYSAHIHAAELGLARTEAAAGGAVDDPLCRFAVHHPSMPEVVRGEVACRGGASVAAAVHEAELRQLDAAVAAAQAEGSVDNDTASGYCLFIAHHPTWPQVANGDVACRINKLQGTPCVAGQPTAPQHCGP